MACFYPLKGWRSRKTTENGKRGIVFDMSAGFHDQPMQVPCGQCIGCRLERSRQWALRCMHESQMHQDNCFVTLTYNDKNLPPGGSLSVPKYEWKENKKGELQKYQVESSDIQKFIKRLRKSLNVRISYFQCGEYGSENSRPHHHALLFGHDFQDKELWSLNHMNNRIYRSAELERLWPYGFSTIGDVTFESAAYVARYVTKKITGEQALEAYCKVDKMTGEILHELQPEYCSMSRNPGIGKEWFEAYSGDVFPKDFITLRGLKLRPPKYYDNLYELNHEEEMMAIKGRRTEHREKHLENNTDERLEVRERIQRSQFNMLKRGAEQ